jgi:hypothetical protein
LLGVFLGKGGENGTLEDQLSAKTGGLLKKAKDGVHRNAQGKPIYFKLKV